MPSCVFLISNKKLAVRTATDSTVPKLFSKLFLTLFICWSSEFKLFIAEEEGEERDDRDCEEGDCCCNCCSFSVALWPSNSLWEDNVSDEERDLSV